MKASIGDRIVVVAPQVGGAVRDCLVVELRNPDGSPPYVVRWSDNGREGLYFPGVDGHVEHPESEPSSQAEPTVTVIPKVRTWNVEVQVYERGASTTAKAVLRAGSDTPFEARGSARRAPGDPDVPEIGDEVAVSRALRHLADSLLEAAEVDISETEHRDVKLSP